MDAKFKQRVDSFLSKKNIAIVGYSSNGNEVANHLYLKFKDNGYNVFPVNIKASEVKDVDCYPNIKAIPEKVDAAMLSIPSEKVTEVINECIELGIKNVWLHKFAGPGSYNKEAIKLAEENGVEIVPLACPMMFIKADGAHKFFKWFMNLTGKLKIRES